MWRATPHRVKLCYKEGQSVFLHSGRGMSKENRAWRAWNCELWNGINSVLREPRVEICVGSGARDALHHWLRLQVTLLTCGSTGWLAAPMGPFVTVAPSDWEGCGRARTTFIS